MSKQKLNDIFENSDTIKYDDTLNESASDGSVVDGVNILGRVYGPFFQPNGESANKRFYSHGLWENALAKTDDTVKGGRMVGTIGHEQPLSDKDLLEGKGSHRITKLWIDHKNNVGMGEAVILNTTAGRELNAYLRGGVKLAVSSRAFGEYSGKTESGSHIVKADTYDLECFDFVRVPGISIAFPSLVESGDQGELPPTNPTDSAKVESNNHSVSIESKDKSIIPENKMSDQLVQSLTEDKINLQRNVTEALDKCQILEQKLDTANTANETLKSSLAQKDADLATAANNLTESNNKLNEATAALADYQEIGTSESIRESLSLSTAMVEELEQLGTIDQINKVMDITEEYAELGSPSEVSDALDSLEAYVEVGSVEDISKAVEVAKACESAGGMEEINKKLELLKTYEELGTPEEINKVFDMTQAKIQEAKDEVRKAEIAKISNTFGVDATVVEELLKNTDVAGATKVLESLQANNVGHRYKKQSDTPTTIVESSDNSTRGTRLGRLIENMNR